MLGVNRTSMARTVTVTANQVRMNNGEGFAIAKEDSESVLGAKSWPAPTETHPHRVITMVMGVTVSAENTTFLVARTAESDGASCSDVYRVSIE